MTGSTNVGNDANANIELTAYAFQENEKDGKYKMTDEKGNKGEFSIIPGATIAISSVKPGATPELMEKPEYRTYRNNIKAMQKRYKEKEANKDDGLQI